MRSVFVRRESNMLGKFVKVAVTHPIGSENKQYGYKYQLNFGDIQSGIKSGMPRKKAYIMGINHPVVNFEGRVIAIIKRKSSVSYVVAPKRMKFIENQIVDALAGMEKDYRIECLYEHSCGAVVSRVINGHRRYLLIKNRRSAHWGFPKGHVERGETEVDTAKREVLEETGIHINILPDFVEKSEYSIKGKIEKTVAIFLATTTDTRTTIQREEIEDYIWLEYDNAIKTLKFPNDKMILEKAEKYLNGMELN